MFLEVGKVVGIFVTKPLEAPRWKSSVNTKTTEDEYVVKQLLSRNLPFSVKNSIKCDFGNFRMAESGLL